MYLQRYQPSQHHQGNGHRQLLLIDKLSGHGQGLVNAPGGKVEPSETVHACAVREVAEEVGVVCSSLTLRACLRFVQLTPRQNPSNIGQAELDSSATQWLGFAFTGNEFRGTPRSSPEAIPRWHRIAKLPWQAMWPTDKFWLPQLLVTPPADQPILNVTLQFAGEQQIHHNTTAISHTQLQDQLKRYGLRHLVS